MNTQTENHALEQANAQMRSVREMVAALECDYDRLEEMRDEFSAFEGAEADAAALGKAEWPCDVTSNPGEDYIYEYDVGRELAELEAQAGENESRDDAETAIRQDALSVEIRGDWRTVDCEAEDSEFRIVLCTGGPHVQISGELNNGEPTRAWLEYQDWGTPMTERVNDEGDQNALLTYAQQFFFGE